MKHTTHWAQVRWEFHLEDWPRIPLNFTADNAEFVPDLCVVLMGIEGAESLVMKEIRLAGHRVNRDGRAGKAAAEQRYHFDAGVEGRWFPEPPDHVLSLVDEAMTGASLAQAARFQRAERSQ
ncbi:hypothetical protein [Nocardia sp. NPDC057030]|uniref:hypothetical protein n=1 Tax=unclassified Nocardia TaxID=2637762 RepID=UPI00362C8806